MCERDEKTYRCSTPRPRVRMVARSYSRTDITTVVCQIETTLEIKEENRAVLNTRFKNDRRWYLIAATWKRKYLAIWAHNLISASSDSGTKSSIEGGCLELIWCCKFIIAFLVSFYALFIGPVKLDCSFFSFLYICSSEKKVVKLCNIRRKTVTLLLPVVIICYTRYDAGRVWRLFLSFCLPKKHKRHRAILSYRIENTISPAVRTTRSIESILCKHLLCREKNVQITFPFFARA